jgi:putative nucleotidyltransferase with HDIG domain
MNLSPKGQLYVAVVAAAGLLVVGHCITVLIAQPVGWEYVILAMLTLLSGSFTVRIPSFQARISVSETFVFTTVLLFGECAGTLTVALDVLVAAITSQRRTLQPIRVLFNISSASLSLWIASSLFYLTAGIKPLSVEATRVPELVWPLVLLTSVHFILNSGLVTIAMASERNESAIDIWLRIFPWLSINYFGGASVAALLVSYTRTVDFFALSLLVPLLVISYLTYKTALGRVADAMTHLDEIRKLYLSTIETLATAIDAKDQVTHGHIRRVQKFALGLARKVGVTDQSQLQALEAAALLHDMGKIAVPEHILNKPSKLSPGEFEKMKLHASVGAEILSSIQFPYPVVPIVRHHHENWNGTGYPDSLKGTEIPLGARILAVVDCFDALTSDRPYRPRLSDAEAIAILMQRRGSMYDPLVVDTFVAVKDQLAEELRTSLEPPSSVEDVLKAMPSKSSSGTAVTSSKLTANTLELRHGIRTVLNAIELELATSHALVYLRDQQSDELVIVDAVGSKAEELVGSSLPIGTRISGWVAANGRAIVNTDARLEFLDWIALPSDYVSAVFPVRIAGDVLGVLVAVRANEKVFTTEETKFLDSVCTKFDEQPLRELIMRAVGLIESQKSPASQRVH